MRLALLTAIAVAASLAATAWGASPLRGLTTVATTRVAGNLWKVQTYVGQRGHACVRLKLGRSGESRTCLPSSGPIAKLDPEVGAAGRYGAGWAGAWVFGKVSVDVRRVVIRRQCSRDVLDFPTSPATNRWLLRVYTGSQIHAKGMPIEVSLQDAHGAVIRDIHVNLGSPTSRGATAPHTLLTDDAVDQETCVRTAESSRQGGSSMRPTPGLILLATISAATVGPAAVGATALRTAGSVTVTRIIATPGRQHVLERGHLNVVYVHPGLAFNVSFRNDVQRRNAQVTLTITRKNAGAIVQRKIVTFAPLARTQVKFSQLNPRFARRETLKLTVTDRAHREVWTTTYPIIFALG